MKDLIKKLVEAWGPSGYEHQVRAHIREEVAPYADEITVDALGNLICRVGQGGKKIMIAAHMDEIGLMATFIEKTTGYVRFSAIGGLMNTALLGTRVKFENGVVGVVGMPEYFQGGRTTAPALEQYYIDVSDGSGESPVQPGMPAAFNRELDERGSRLISKAMDDRIGCVVAIETMRRINKQTPHELYFVFTVQEEVGLRGARPAAYTVNPDVGIALDVTIAGDMIGIEKNLVTLGGGAAIKLLDSGLVVPPAVRDWMVDCAEANAISYQMETLTLGSTDAAGIHVARGGVPSGAISIPCRFVHTVSETVETSDIEACVALMQGLVSSPLPEAL
ncbi:MAG TPA: M20/M25/M40 family metallo-hydrolase [Candidatus Limnocylindrales bacterium]|nr:M20/M25/M40 family metallo-hydrolase [Candidatus Limnocylindrales bacterium]